MVLPITSGAVLNIVASIAEFALIAFLLSVRPITRLQVWLAVYAGALATSNVIASLVSPLQGAWAVAYTAVVLTFNVGVVAFALALPGRVSGRAILVAALAGVVIGAIDASSATTTLGMVLRAFGGRGPTAFFIALAAARYGALPPGESDQKRQIVILSVGLAVNFFGAGTRLDAQGGPFLTALSFVLVSSAAWLIVAARMPKKEARTARNLALLFPALVLVGIGAARLAGGPAAYAGKVGATSISNLWIVAMFVYAIVRHQLLGIDLKVRWTISKSTIAAVFVAVFFVASELAQQLFGAAFGGAYAGIVAAGALVFAMAPLQRAAERLAEKAVPITTQSPIVASTTAKEESYKRALRLALRDRALSREEDIHLHELAEHLGIGAGRAMTLRVEIERELQRDRV